MNCLYRMPENGQGGCVQINSLDAPHWNNAQNKNGIFWTIQEFNGPRVKANITHIRGFGLDIDTGDKEQSLNLIRKGLLPTWLIETKNGYHVYFLFDEPMPCEYSEELEQRYRHTVVNRLIPFYSADPKAADLARLLRAPYFHHWKNPLEPFLVLPIEEIDCRYTWDRIEAFYPDVVMQTRLTTTMASARRALKIANCDDLFDRIYKMDCKHALEILSGTAAVCGDVYTFRKTASGSQNIISNGKGTSCWVDKEGRIGSLDKGGPTIWCWLFWYHHDHKKVYQVMKEAFPEVIKGPK